MEAYVSKFEGLRIQHKERGVIWRMSPESNVLHFMSFFNKSGVKGVGGECLKEVCTLADQLDVPLKVMTSRPYLVGYFERFGFTLTRETRMTDSYTVRAYNRLPKGERL